MRLEPAPIVVRKSWEIPMNVSTTGRTTRPRLLLGGLAAAVSLIAITACGGPAPAGPNVEGMALPAAEKALEEANISYSTQAKDGSFGVLVKDNWVVCDQIAVNENSVRLEVAKRGC